MASAAVHVADWLQALQAGEVPGELSPDRTEYRFPVLEYPGARGALHRWTIRVRLLRDGAEGPVAIGDAMLAQPAEALEGLRAEITTESCQVGGKVRDVVPTYVSSGKNLGKRNATNALTQALRDALGLFNKHKKRASAEVAPGAGCGAEEEGAPPAAAAPARAKPSAAAAKAAAAAVAAAGPPRPGAFDPRPPPMLVKVLGASRDAMLTPADFASGVTAQRKYNGVHFVAYAEDGPSGAPARLVGYSRTGGVYPGQAHVAAELLPMIAAAPPISPGEYGTPGAADTEEHRQVLRAYGALPGAPRPTPYFAGELYVHGKSLNWISGQARRADDSGELDYHVFDVFFPHAIAAGHNMESRHRQAYLRDFFAMADADGLPHPHIVEVEGVPVRSMGELQAVAKRFLSEGYEGAIARKDDAGYRYSYNNLHSGNLVKIKPVHDDEFPVIGYTQGEKGKDYGAVIWICEVPNPIDMRDRTFTVVPKDMTYEERKRLYHCLGDQVIGPDGQETSRFDRDVKGRPLTVQYAELSAKTGKPLQAKALVFRTYEDGPDPIRRLLQECGL